MGELDRAIPDYDEAIRLDPKYALAYGSRGITYDEKGEFDRAMADYNEAIRLDPKYPIVYGNRGLSYHREGQFDRAMADFNQAIRLDPNHAGLYLARAETRAKLGQVEEALADVDKALEINYISWQGDFLAWFLANFEDPRLRRVDRALELATLPIKQAPNNPKIWTTLGAAEYRAGNWQAAVEALQKSRELKYYNVARTGFFLAMAHWQLGQEDEARQSYQKAAKWMEQNDPEDNDLRRFRTEAAELLGIKNEEPKQRTAEDAEE